MIEPFSAEQIREENGHKIVSYGTSSYGYDIRCAREFKIFTYGHRVVQGTALKKKTYSQA